MINYMDFIRVRVYLKPKKRQSLAFYFKSNETTQLIMKDYNNSNGSEI
jgi:hypothetical protein